MLCFPLSPLPSPQHHSPSSSSSSDSYDSDYDRPERPKNRKSQGSSRESDGQSSQVSSSPLACWRLILTQALLCDIYLFDLPARTGFEGRPWQVPAAQEQWFWQIQRLQWWQVWLWWRGGRLRRRHGRVSAVKRFNVLESGEGTPC